jgi:hypothetical protein
LITGVFGLFLSGMMFGDIGVAGMFGAVDALLLGVGF